VTGDPARSAARPDLVLILGLATVAATATVGVWAGRTAFPLLTDEADYLGRACQRVGFESLAWGPLYAALYCALRRVSDDPFGVFWAKQAAVPLAAGALFHRLGLAYGLGPLLSPLAALWCVLALIVVNGTNEFAILLGLTACLWAVSGGRRGWTGFYALMGAASLVRPEYLVGLGAAALLRLGRRYGRGRAAAVAAVVALAAGLAVGRKSGGESRSWFAFGQQFAVNSVEARGAGPDPYVEWRSIAARAFPSSASISDAARENPRMVAWHLRYNLSRRLPRAAANLFVPIPSFVLWPFPLREALAATVLVLVLVTAPAGARKLVRASGPSLTPLLALATLPSVSLLFRPAARHLLPVLPLVVVLVGTALKIEPDEAPSRVRAGRRWLFGSALLLGLVSPWAFWAHTTPPAPTLTEWIRGLRQDARSGPVRLLGTWYADRTCALVGPSCRAVSIAEFLEGQEVDAALIGPDWDARADVQSDARLRKLPSRPEDYGCVASAPPADGLRLIRCGPAGRRGPPP
jgi:hypothetical protein